MTNMARGFSLTLEDCHIDDITAAFKFWMESESAMPTPADIRKLAVERRGFRESAGRTVTNTMAQPVQRGLDPWCYKPYPQAKEDGTIEAFFSRFRPMSEAGREWGYEWLRYAVNHLEYPRQILALFRAQMALPAEQKVKPCLIGEMA
ncbi:hypothetical protein [Methylobacterium oryzae]|uniref:hypothetical protein n=1 Tax=Methylobacterium oryzae TaxID=334852 RepID=UPI002F354351